MGESSASPARSFASSFSAVSTSSSSGISFAAEVSPAWSRSRIWSTSILAIGPSAPQRAQPRTGESSSVPAVNAPSRSAPSICAFQSCAW